MGKISEKDYQELKSQYKVKALEMFKELDGLNRKEGNLDAEIEREVRLLRRKNDINTEKRDRREPVWEMNFCRHCGKRVDPDHVFCQGCGMRLIPPVREEQR